MSSQAIRSAELLEWAENPEGCGIEQLYDAYLRATKKKPGRRNLRKEIFTNLLVTGLTTSLVIGMRWFGILQGWELQAFDHLMRQRPHEIPDSRLLVVQATSEDIDNQKEKPKEDASLSDHTLKELLEQLKQYEPIAIGLDIYRPFLAEPELKPYLKQENLFGICKAKAEKFDDEGFKPPPEIPLERVGFVDAPEDNDGILRRHLLSRKPDLTWCTAQDSLSFNLALDYLWKEYKIQFAYTPKNELQLGKAIFRELKSHSGGYQDVDARGRQIMLNYRSLSSLKDIAYTVTVGDILDNNIPDDMLKTLKKRIIIIGIARQISDSSDHWETPYREEIPGVFIQAHMVSQLLSAALENRSLLWALPTWGDIIWIWIWSIVGGVIAYQVRSPRSLGICTGLALGILYGICYLSLLRGIWIPLIPSAIVVILNAVYIELAELSRSKQRDL